MIGIAKESADVAIEILDITQEIADIVIELLNIIREIHLNMLNLT